MPDLPPRRPKDSLVEMTEIVLPEDTNPHGTIFGGRVLALVDKCAAICAMRHARSETVTASVDSVDFRNPVRLGEVLILHGRMNAAFGSSMEIEVEVQSENPLTGRITLTTRAFVTVVATDTAGRPKPVPQLACETDEEKRSFEQAAERRKARLARRR